jgi:hypothetical protein
VLPSPDSMRAEPDNATKARGHRDENPLARRSAPCLPAAAAAGGYSQHVTNRNRRNSLQIRNMKISTRNINRSMQSCALTSSVNELDKTEGYRI